MSAADQIRNRSRLASLTRSQRLHQPRSAAKVGTSVRPACYFAFSFRNAKVRCHASAAASA